MQRTLRIDLEYDGTDFEGWQRQVTLRDGREPRTVQGELERAAERILGAPHTVLGSSRTDAGVHAAHQVASLRTTNPIATEVLARGLDALLPPDVGVLAVREVEADFHPIASAEGKWYRYRLLFSETKRPLRARFVWRHAREVPLALLAAATDEIVGTHDFSAFANTGAPRRDAVRAIRSARWTTAGAEAHFDIVGEGFLYKMVRTIVGSAVDFAREAAAMSGTDPVAAAADVGRRMQEVLAGQSRQGAGVCAPARGLCLMATLLPGEESEVALPEGATDALQ